jgi:hypothetical protein
MSAKILAPVEPAWKIRLAAITKQREDERLAAAIAESKLIEKIQQPTETITTQSRQSEVDSKSAVESPPSVTEPPDSLIVHRQTKTLIIDSPVEEQPKITDPPQPITPTPATSTTPTISLDTHFYDGKLIGEVGSLGMLPVGPDFDSQLEHLRAIMEHYSALKGRSSQWVPYFMTILQDHHTNPQANFDPSNGVDAAQVLYNINLKLVTLLELSCIQLEEMASGGCPQGRAARLLSVLLST